MKLAMQIISAVAGTAWIVFNPTNHWGVVTVGGLMIVNYLLFMATLPAETNMISYHLSDYSVVHKVRR